MAVRCALALALVLLGGCGPSQSEQWAARMQSLQWQLDATYGDWQTEVAQQRFRTNAEAARDLEARYQGIYRRWFQQPDPFSQAILSMAVALATRVDRAELDAGTAERLYGKLRVDLDQARRDLAQEHPATFAERDARMLERWRAYWATHRQAYAIPPGSPIRCTLSGDAGQDISVRCE